MRHRVRGRRLRRTPSHRLALRRNLAANIFTHGRIVTTMPRAKEVRSFVEKLITLSKKAIAKKETDKAAYVHYYRMILSKLQNKELVQKLVGEGKWREGGGIAQRYLTRNGGYTRIMRLSGSRLGVLTGGKVGKIPELEYTMGGVNRKLRLVGYRLGDNADRVIFELVEGPGDEAKKEETAEAPKVEAKKPGQKKPRTSKTETKAEVTEVKKKEAKKPATAGKKAGETTGVKTRKAQATQAAQAEQGTEEEREDK